MKPMKYILSLATLLLAPLATLTAAEIKTVNPDRRVISAPVMPSISDFKPVRVCLSDQTPVQTLQLDGIWLFQPIVSALTPQAQDEDAKRIVECVGPVKSGIWHPLAVPQFLNRYAWWLDISQKFVQADKARLAAIPFDAEKTQAGWYRQQIELPKVAGPLPEVVVNFEGVAMLSRVYCNGHYVGGHVGMFGQFECRLTPHLNWGATNTLLVYAERGTDVKGADEVVSVAVTVPVTRGMLASLNHGMFGGFGRGAFAKMLGIWQPVTLKVSQPGGRIADVFFRPALEGHAIEIAVQNPGAQAVTGRLHYQVRNRQSGTLLYAEGMETPLELAGESTRTITLEKHGLAPKLWSPDFPNLYDLVIEWQSADGLRLLDRWTHPVGYRTVEVKGTQLYLNGHPYWTRGAGMPVYGYKPNDETTARAFLRRMHEGNQMVTRSGCNPWNRLWFGAADEEGVGIACEGVRPWALMSKQPPPAPAILAQWKTEQLETVRQYRNHPSILFYCVSNEGLQGDHDNPEKLALYRDIINSMRQADPTRPICQTSGEPDAAGNADIEDVHSYWGWYEPSSFVFDYDAPRRGLHAGDGRAFINKETAVPYQDTDTGGVHPNYVGRYSAHPWVGELGAEGNEPAYFAEHVRAEAKLKTEKLRRQRQSLPTAGMILFANTTWIGNVLTAQPDQWKFFPVWEGVRQALAPVLVGWTTTRHVFFAGDTVQTRAFVVNDDARFRDLKGLTLKADVLAVSGSSLVATEQSLGEVAYFTAQDWPLEIRIPTPEGCDKALTAATVRLTLSDGSGAVTTNCYPIRIAERSWALQGGNALAIAAEGCSPRILACLRATGSRILTVAEARNGGIKCDAVVLGPQATSLSEPEVSAVIKPGGRLLALQQGAAARRLCPEVYPVPQPVWCAPQGYEFCPQGLRVGARWATDRDFTFAEIPARLAGAAQIVTRMDDKASDPEQPLLRFRLPVGGRVLVAYDSRAKTLPGWLLDWTKTGETLGVSTGFRLNLFEKTFAPGEVVLGGNLGAGVTAMYAVAVLPAEGRGLERLELGRQGEGKVGADNTLDHFMFNKGDRAAESTIRINGEFVEMLGWEEGRPLFAGLDAMDWKWWACGEGQPALACTATHRIDITRKEVIPLGRFLESHFYWSGDLKKVYASKLTWPVFAVRRSWGTLVVCELALGEAIDHDPRAARTLCNLLTQTMDTKGPLLAPSALLASEPSAPPQSAAFRVNELKTDYRQTPLGLEARHLRFCWRVNEGDQSAWQVQAAGSPDKLASGNADLWDSGKRAGVGTTQIAYEGKPLSSRQRAWWRVRVWNATGMESPWSEPGWFEMGLLEEGDWQGAQWIGCDRHYNEPQYAPQEQMGPWIEPPAGQQVTSIFKDIVLPDKQVVSAMVWWGTSKKVGKAAVLINFDQTPPPLRARMERLMRAEEHPYGFYDMAFCLKPGAKNRVEFRLKKPASDLALTLGMKIVFGDGTEMALLSGDDWQAIPAAAGAPPVAVTVAEPYGGPKFGQAKQFEKTDLPPAWFRGTFEIRKDVKRARLYLSALGQGEPFVNGKATSDALLGPPQSDYEAFGFYTTQDVTKLLDAGTNALSVLLNPGWYHEVGGFGHFRGPFSYGRPGLKALVAVEYADGKTEWFTSGPDWQWKEGALRSANIYRGERLDFRLDHEEWKTPAAGTGWKRAQVIPPLTPKTMSADVNPIRRIQELKPVKSWQAAPKTWLFDVGEVLHGWLRFSINEPEGATVRVRYSEYARAGVIENVPGSQWECHGVLQGDILISDGKKRLFEPTFATKSFRYVEVSGVSKLPEDLSVFAVNSDVRPLANFESSDPMLNRLFANGMRTWRNYMFDVLRDIPRERCMWGAESIYTEIPGTYCYDLAPNHRLMNRLWLTGDMSPQGIPGDIGVGKRLNRSANSYIWSVTPVFLASLLFEHYGDLEPARSHYEKLRFIVQYPETTGKMGGTLPIPQMYTDHAPVMDVKRNPANGDLLSGLIYLDALNRFARLADALGKPEDAIHTLAHAQKVRTSLMTFYNTGKHTFGNGTHDSLALAFGVLGGQDEQEKLATSLVGYYRANGHQFDGGFLSYEIYPQLSRYGYVDDAVKMLVNTTPPGPARSVKDYDATSFWEIYWLDHDRQMAAGLNFVANAHSIGWMLTDLAGIRYKTPLGQRPQLTLAPKFASELNYVRSAVEIPSGIVRSDWKRASDGTIRWNITIPWNTTTTAILPGFSKIAINGKPVEKSEFALSGGKWEIIMDK